MMNKLTAYRAYLLYSCLTALLFSLIFTVTLVYQVEVVHLSPLQLVLAGTTFEVVSFIFEIPTGIVADTYSRKLSIIIGLAIMGTGFVIQGSFPTYAAVLISQVLWGIGSTFTSGAVEAWIAEEETDRNISEVFLKGAQLGQIGSVVGILLSTALANWALFLPITIGGAMFMTLAPFFALFMPEAHFSCAAPTELCTFKKMVYTIKSGLTIIKNNFILTMIMLIALFNGLSSEGYDRLYTAHFLQDTTLPRLWNLKPVTWFGIFGILGILISITVMGLVIRCRKHMGDRAAVKTLSCVNLLYILSMVVFGLAGNFSVMLAAYLSINMLKAVNKPILSALTNRYITGSARATILSTNEQVNSFGEMLGGPIIGFIADRYSIGSGIAASAVFLIPVVLIFINMKGKTSRTSRP